MYWQSGGSGVRVGKSVRGSYRPIHWERPLMILKPVKQTSTAAALKAERDRDMAQAVQDYEDEQCARLANMARLRALRLENERAESKVAASPSAKKKKAATESRRGPLEHRT
jgi:hypothetical protein